jgi:hypothetical protein
MQAIITKYHGWTHTKPSRLSATTGSGEHRVYLSLSEVDGGATDYESHFQAAKKLMKKLGWNNNIIGGGIKDGYAFVLLTDGDLNRAMEGR